ncbi:helix-turn-helix transcriptional regulator [Paenibacillus ginsengarvi]|uniref:WYL domain-containing protein n=1 Tax=Paenibacillus ginsengarvi TaxID=400777 RepID=A0A3B0CII4_9BACL|nr:WYL domain-containing protein [Paenibacillus ginsengarvi]RKN85475.1 WYL domain-containing protein [Paenibacillus ginsengarvi]
MRADRLLSILLLLQTYGKMTAAELAQRLEVSERTIHRDMESLSSAGVPVAADRGTGGGWRLMNDYRTNLTGLQENEIASLFLSVPDKALDDLGWRRSSEGALIKLLAALPGKGRSMAEFVRERIYLDSNGWRNYSEAADALPVLLEATLQERQIIITYEKSGGASSKRRLSPLGLVMKGTVWYLIGSVEGEDAGNAGNAGAGGDVRTYRVSRIVQCGLTEERAVRPPDFQLASYWDASKERFVANLPRFEAKLRVRAESAYFVQMWKYATVLERGDEQDGWSVYRIRFQTEEEACRLALSLGGNGELIEPAGLRARIAAMAAEAAEWYGKIQEPSRDSGGSPE